MKGMARKSRFHSLFVFVAKTTPASVRKTWFSAFPLGGLLGIRDEKVKNEKNIIFSGKTHFAKTLFITGGHRAPNPSGTASR